MDLSLEKTLQAVKKEIEALKEKFNKFIDEIMNEKKPAKKTTTKKTAVKKKVAPNKKTVAKKAPVKKATKKTTAKKAAGISTDFDTVIDLISNSNEGVDVTTIATKTGFDSKKIANIIFKAKKRGLIKSAAKGVYVKV